MPDPDEPLCAKCGHTEDDLDDLGMCTVRGCRCVSFRADDEDGEEMDELNFDEDGG